MRPAVWLWLYARIDTVRHFTWARYERARRRQWDRSWEDAR